MVWCSRRCEAAVYSKRIEVKVCATCTCVMYCSRCVQTARLSCRLRDRLRLMSRGICASAGSAGGAASHCAHAERVSSCNPSPAI